MTPREANILTHGTEIAERRIRTARQLQSMEARRHAMALASGVKRLVVRRHGKWCELAHRHGAKVKKVDQPEPTAVEGNAAAS